MPFQKGHGRLRSLESYKTQDKSFMTPEYKNKISELAKSKNYGKWMIGKKLSPETRIKISNANKGKNCGEKNGMVGFEFTEEYRRKLSERSPKGEKCNFWKGGVLPINTQIRSSFEYKQWRRLVFERDNYTCQKCGKWGGRLHAHHKKSFADHIELRFDVNNGETLCKDCHKETDSYLKSNGRLLRTPTSAACRLDGLVI